MKIQFGIPCLDEKEAFAISEVLKSNWIGFGKKCIEFEGAFSDYTKAYFSKSVNSCTSALHLSLIISGVKKGDEVITTPLTFVATVRAIELAGAKPILVDIDRETLNIDCSKIEEAISEKTKAIIPVHFAGMPCDLNLIYNICKKNNIQIIEDAAHAMGAEYDNNKIGFSKKSLTCFSFYPNKNITSIEGGMITTCDEKLAKKIEEFRMMGQPAGAWKRFSQSGKYNVPDVVCRGYKYNMTDVNAAVGLIQLEKLDKFQQVRKRHAKIYDLIFKNFHAITLQKREIDGCQTQHALHFYPIVLSEKYYKVDRELIIDQIRDQEVGVVVHYRPINELTFFKSKYKFNSSNLVNSNYVGKNIISLPIGPSYSDEQINFAGQTILKILKLNLI